MPFQIPNVGDAGAFPGNAQVHAADFDILVSGISGTAGISSGCAVTTTGAANGSVTVAAGITKVGGIYVSTSSGTVAISSNSSGNPRRDLVTVDNTGTKSTVVGTPGAVPLLPAVPSNRVALAAVWVPNGHTGSSTIAAAQIIDKRVFTASNDFEAHNVIQYGAVGNSHHLTGGGADDTAAIQAAYDAAQAAGGFGVVVFPAGRSYRVTDTIEVCPDPAKAPVWTWGIGGMGANQVIALPNIVWDGATDGVVMNAEASGQNLPGALFRNVRITARDIAANCIRYRPTSTNPAKVDTGSGLDEVHIVDSRSHGVLIECKGATNFWIRGGRWDAIGGYAIQMNATSGIHMAIRDVTWDPNGPPAGTTPAGFLHLDGSAMEADTYMMLHLDTIHTEVQVDLLETDAAGANPADRRGVFAFTINPSQQRTQFRVIADNMRTTGHTSSRASHSVFQMLGGTVAQRTARLSLVARNIGPVGGTGADTLGDCIPIGNITNAKQPQVVLGGNGPGHYAHLVYAPGGDNLFTEEKAGYVEILS